MFVIPPLYMLNCEEDLGEMYISKEVGDSHHHPRRRRHHHLRRPRHNHLRPLLVQPLPRRN